MVAQAPLLDADNKRQVAQQLLIQDVSDPIPIPFSVLDEITPQPMLVLDIRIKSDGVLQDFAQMLFLYDGVVVSAEFNPMFQRNGVNRFEKIIRIRYLKTRLAKN